MTHKRTQIALALAGIGVAVLGGSQAAAAAGGSNPAPVSGHYNPHIDPANFVRKIDNRYLPFKPGTKTVSKGVAEDGKTPQRDVAVVTHRTRKILGVSCRVVRDTITSRGEPVERTFDWYAQDKDGNVWYFGENSNDYRHGHWVKSDGSWEAGVDGAKPGIMMEAHPKRGDSYRQEYYRGHAEDRAKVLGDGGRVTSWRRSGTPAASARSRARTSRAATRGSSWSSASADRALRHTEYQRRWEEPRSGGALLSASRAGYAASTRPIRWPSGSVKWPMSMSVPGIWSGPIRRVPPRLSAFWSAASTSGTAT